MAQKAELDAVMARVTSLTGEQSAGRKASRGDTLRGRTLRTRLREQHLAPISRIAKATLSDAPGISKALGMPSAQLPAMRLVAEALGMKTAAAPYADTFVANGLSDDFLDRLDAAIEAVRQTVLGRARSVGCHVGAKAGLKQELARGRRAVDKLDAIVLTAFAGQEEILARWRIAKRVQELPGSGLRATGGTADENVPETPPAAA